MEQLQDGVAQVAQTAKATADAYRGDEQRPLGGYVVIMALFGALLSGAAGLALSTGRRLPPASVPGTWCCSPPAPTSSRAPCRRTP